MIQARRLKPTETLQEYFLTMRDLAHKGAVDDSSLIDYIIDGIPDSSNNKIILYGSKTLSEFKDKLKIYETLLNSKHSKQFPDKRFRDYENSTSNQHRIEHKRFTNQQPICYLCGLKGHKSTLCPNKHFVTLVHIINEKTYQKLGSPTLNPSQYTFSGIVRDRVESKGYFKNFIAIQNTALPAKIHVVNDETIHSDAIIGIDFLQQTKFTFGRDGIRIFRDVDECKMMMLFGKPCQPFDEQQCKLDLPHISNSKIRNDVEQLVSPTNLKKKLRYTDLKMVNFIGAMMISQLSQRSRRLLFVEQKNCRKPNSRNV
ncbi:transposon Tf2-9 polyprotein [Trichonephila clavipes]|nr:transposon Tf2-9 polyprotein [Trichonephila clavipes]